MCEALEELLQEKLEERLQEKLEERLQEKLEAVEARAVEQGIEQGIKAVIEICRSLGITWKNSLEMLLEKFHLTQPDAEKYMQIYW